MTNNKCATVVNIMGLKFFKEPLCARQLCGPQKIARNLGPTIRHLGPTLKPTLHRCSVLPNSVLNPVFVFQIWKFAIGLYACMTYVHTCHT